MSNKSDKSKSSKSSKKSKSPKSSPDNKSETKFSNIMKYLKNQEYEELDIDLVEFINDIPNNEFIGDFKYDEHKIKEITKGYTMIGCISINTELTHSDKLFVFANKETHKYLFGFDKMPVSLWYEVNTLTEAKSLMNLYNNGKYNEKEDFENRLRIYIGNKHMLNMDFNGIQKYLLLSDYSEKILWNYNKFGKRSGLHKMSTYDVVANLTNSLDDTMTEVNVYSKYSKSLLKFETHNGHYIVDISFNSTKNKRFIDDKFKYNKLPSDVIALLNQFILWNGVIL